MRTSERLAGPRVLVGVAAPSDLAGSILVEILYCGEGEDVEQVARTLKQFSHVYNFLSFSLLTCLYILHAHIVHVFI